MTRWKRLERYAKWKQAFPLLQLPEDVVGMVADLLSDDDLYNFLEALLGFKPHLTEPSHMRCIPPPLRKHWFDEVVMQRFLDKLRRFSELGLFFSTHLAGALVFVDWSQFANTTPSPVAEYAWTRAPVKSNAILHSDRIKHVAAECLRKRMPAVRLTLHLYCFLGGSLILNPLPVTSELYTLYPAYVCNG
jgi:hypothetical protein